MQELASQQTLGAPELAPVDRVAMDSESFASFAASTRTPVCHADRYASPGLADAWAQAIITSWRAAYAADQLDLSQPLYVIDLASGSGHLARLLLRALRHHLADFQAPSPLRGGGWGEGLFEASGNELAQTTTSAPRWTIRYLACITPGSNAPQLDDDCFDTICWSPLDSHVPPPSNNHAFRLHESSNPVIVLALNYLQAFPGQLRAVHYGEWLEGRVHITSEHDNGCELEYDWQTIIADDPYCPATLQQRYLRTLSHSCVLIPDVGLHALQRIAELTHGRFLWLAADQGAIDEKQLRFGAMLPPIRWSYEAQPIPVNFHALAYDQSARGAWCWHGQPHEDGMVVQVIWRHDDIPAARSHYSNVADLMRCFQPDDALHLETLASALAPESPASLHLALLRGALHDPRVLRGTLAAWMENPPELTDAERSHWGDAIARAWQICPRGDDEIDLRHSMAVFAVQLGRLDIGRAVFEHDDNRVCVALCHAQGGRIDHALSCVEGIDDSQVETLRGHWQKRLALWQSLGWYHAEISYDDELCLIPLEEHLAQELYEQYRDPQIGELTRLPELDTQEAASEWIAEQSRESGRATYAVMHADKGLIGVVSMQAHDEDAYFYFWIGSAHQGRGYGRRVARLLCRQAELGGIRRLFTSAYQSNQRSIEALSAVQFWRMPITAVPPDDDLVFFVRHEGHPRLESGALPARLGALLEANGSPITLRF